MADECKARPVSGEIMAGAPGCGATRAAPGDIVEAQYEIVAPAAPGSEPPPAVAGSPLPPLAGMEMLRSADRAPVRRGVVRAGPAFWAFGVAAAAIAFWAAGGHALVRGLPALSEHAPAGALRLSGVTSRVGGQPERPLLFVDGEAANDGEAAQDMPPLDILVTGQDGLVTRYRLGTNERSLPPGETFAFSSRLDAPKSGVKTVSVAFGD